MDGFIISGGKRLEGEIPIHGAKNSALPLLAATLLVQGVSEIHNCPCLSDVTASMAILRHLGCRVTRQERTVTVDAISTCVLVKEKAAAPETTAPATTAAPTTQPNADTYIPTGIHPGVILCVAVGFLLVFLNVEKANAKLLEAKN